MKPFFNFITKISFLKFTQKSYLLMKFIIKNQSLHKRCAQSDPGAIFISSKVGVFDAIKGLCKSNGLLSASNSLNFQAL